MSILFENKIAETELEEMISKTLNSKLLKFSGKFGYEKTDLDISKIIFCENFLHYKIDRKKKYPRDPWSLQRKMQYTILEDLRDLFEPNQISIDIASQNKNMLSFLGLNKKIINA